MKGKIHAWDKQKHYGIIQVENSCRHVLAHITEFSHKQPPPQIGEEVTFDLFANQEKNGKSVARNIQYIHREMVGVASYKAHKKRRAARRRIYFALATLMGIVLLSFVAYKGSQIMANEFTSQSNKTLP